MKIKNLIHLLALSLFLALPLTAQQPAAQQGQPIYPTNAKYVQGVGPGYWPTPGTGLTLNIAAGTCYLYQAVENYAGGTLTLPASSTVYVYLDTEASCAPAYNTTGFSETTVPIATVITGASAITSVTDVRSWMGTATLGSHFTVDAATINNLTATNINGAPPAGGTVSSVGVQGDGTVIKTTLNGSPVTSTGTIKMSLVPAPAGYVLAGPIASLGSNVAVRQYVICESYDTSSGLASLACPAFASPVVSGDKILALVMQTAIPATATTFTDTLGSSFTNGTVGSTQDRYGFATLASSGSDQVTINNLNHIGTNASVDYIHLGFAVELVGTASLASASGSIATNITAPVTNTVTLGAAASTDALLRFSDFSASYAGHTNTVSGTANHSPLGSIIGQFSSSDVPYSFGTVDLFVPGNTALTDNKASFNATSQETLNNADFIVFDLAQDVSAGSSAPTYRRLQEGDLPASAVSAVQSVNKYSVSSAVNLPSATNTTVLSETITMPSDGCPCRVQVITSGIVNSTASGTWTSWVSDGTSDYATTQSITTDGHAPPLVGDDYSDAYSNSESVTFTWYVNPGTYGSGTMQINSAAASSTSSQGSYMDLIVLQSRN